MRTTTPVGPSELILVGGSYKSGTSLLCQQIEELGYANPARTSNPNELGHGLTVPLYPTRECSICRGYNRRLVDAEHRESNRLERDIVAYLGTLLHTAGERSVIKDPYLKLLAPLWVRAARTAGYESVKVLITCRDPRAIHASISNSRFLVRERNRAGKVFTALSRPLERDFYRTTTEAGAQVTLVRYSPSNAYSFDRPS